MESSSKNNEDFVVDVDTVIANERAVKSSNDRLAAAAAAAPAAPEAKPKRIAFFTLYRYSTLNERLMFVFAVLCAGVHGAACEC